MALCNLKIELEGPDEEKRVPPDLMRMLLDFAEHRDLCDQCRQGFNNKTGKYCATGVVLFDEITRHPAVTVEPCENEDQTP